MVLLDAALRAARGRVAGIASFDHGTGAHARDAVALVRRVGEAHGIRVIVGVAGRPERTEAGWRAARWTFLLTVGRALGARVATAHTADDQLETVCMRVLRGSGARGLAGLEADSPVLRPLLCLRRSDIAAYATAMGIDHREDPTNASRRYFRNRVRHDLLPAIAQVQPGFASDMVRLAREAATIRRALDGVAAQIVIAGDYGGTAIPLSALHGMTGDDIAALAPSLAARAGIVLDRRGTTRLTQFILKSRVAARVPLSGGGEAVRIGERIVIRRTVRPLSSTDEVPLGAAAVIGAWRFQPVVRSGVGDVWIADLPGDRALTVRGWRAGDRMRAGGSTAARRVKRFFSDAGIPGSERVGWPVVLADGEIVWIPGVRRSDAATDRSGRPVLRYRCERNVV